MALFSILTVLRREIFSGLLCGIQRPIAWIIAVVASLAGIVWGDGLEGVVISILRFGPDTVVGNLEIDLQPSPNRWIELNLPWLRVILPSVFIFLAAGIRSKPRAVGCFITLAVVWWGFVCSLTVFGVTLARSGMTNEDFIYVSFWLTQTALGFTAAVTVSAWRRGDLWLGLLPAAGLTGGILVVGSLLPGRPFMADGLSLFAVAVAVASSISTKRRMGKSSSRKSIATTEGLSGPYDAFIGYRRDRGSELAMLIKSELNHRGYRVFLDVDNLPPGHFDRVIIQTIKRTPSFILLLSADAFQPGYDATDWFYQEITCAINERKKIIPIIMPGFTYDNLTHFPDGLKTISRHHAIEYSHEYCNAMIEKVARFLGPPVDDTGVALDQSPH